MSSFLKKNLLILIPLLLVYAWFLIFHIPSHPSSLQVLGADSNITLFEQPDAGRAPIIDAIDNARQEVLVEVYLMSDKEIIDSLNNAEKRGVAVNVMLEEHPFGGGNLNNKTLDTLKSDGIAVKWTNPSYSLTHEKAIVIDSKEVFVLTENLTTSSFTKNREYDVLDTDLKDVTEVRNIFMADWQRQSFSPPATHLIVSPENSRAGLTTLIKGTTKTIDIESEDINDNQIVDLLIDRAKIGQVRLIVPTFSQVASNKKAVEELVQSGVLVKTLSSPYIHAKLILVDETKAYIGSVNLSAQSMDENRELGIMLSENESIKILNETFTKDWDKGTPVN